jgi:hypothetical protein
MTSRNAIHTLSTFNVRGAWNIIFGCRTVFMPAKLIFVQGADKSLATGATQWGMLRSGEPRAAKPL